MWKPLTAVAPLALVAGLLAGCNDDSSGASPYCVDLRSGKAAFQALSDDDVDKLDAAFKEIHHLTTEAPEAVADAWKTIDDGVTAMTDALAEAGISLDDLAAMQDGEIPEDVDLTALAELTPKLETFGGPEMDKAAAAIERHAKDECGVTLTSA
jgi:hypothetical protein